MSPKKFIYISTKKQRMDCFEEDTLVKSCLVSTAKNGLGEQMGSERTPRGWHRIHSIIGQEAQMNSVFVGRKWTGEIYSPELAAAFPGRDWILTRILQLDGLEPGRNKNGQVDSLSRYIYIHGTPDATDIRKPGSHGCIRMHNQDMVDLANWVVIDTSVCIE